MQQDPEAAAEYDAVFARPVLSALECVEVYVGTMPHKFVVIDAFRRIFGRRVSLIVIFIKKPVLTD
jgi:hypothetical protein